jgi:hypothetical protein
MDSQGLDRQRGVVAGSDGSAGGLPQPCPRFATRDEWEAWHGSLTWDEQLRRSNLDPTEHEYSEADSAKARAREERRRAQRWDPDPFSYADDRRHGPWPRVDQLEDPALSNTWRMHAASGYTRGGFARRLRQVPYRELVEERLPARARRHPEARLAWLRESIEQEEASLRAALKQVLRERHQRLAADDCGPTARAMAWCHLLAGRCQLRALRELAKETLAGAEREQSQLSLCFTAVSRDSAF